MFCGIFTISSRLSEVRNWQTPCLRGAKLQNVLKDWRFRKFLEMRPKIWWLMHLQKIVVDQLVHVGRVYLSPQCRNPQKLDTFPQERTGGSNSSSWRRRRAFLTQSARENSRSRLSLASGDGSAAVQSVFWNRLCPIRLTFETGATKFCTDFCTEFLISSPTLLKISAEPEMVSHFTQCRKNSINFSAEKMRFDWLSISRKKWHGKEKKECTIRFSAKFRSTASLKNSPTSCKVLSFAEISKN